MALMRAQRSKLTSSQNYTARLKENAGDFGLNAVDVNADSMLVRVRDNALDSRG
jgi:hypothetical protein